MKTMEDGKPKRQSRIGTISLACGLLAFPMGMTFYTALLLPLLGIAAIVTGIYALARTNSPGKRSIAGLVLGVLASLFSAFLVFMIYMGVQWSTISPEEYASIRSGMTASQVARIVGTPGRPVPVPGLGAVYEGRRWRGSKPGTGAVIVFVDDKVFAKQERGMTVAR